MLSRKLPHWVIGLSLPFSGLSFTACTNSDDAGQMEEVTQGAEDMTEGDAVMKKTKKKKKKMKGMQNGMMKKKKKMKGMHNGMMKKKKKKKMMKQPPAGNMENSENSESGDEF